MFSGLTASGVKLLSMTLPLGVSVFTLISTTAWTLWRNRMFSKKIDAKDQQHQEDLKEVKTELDSLTEAHQQIVSQVSELAEFKEKFAPEASPAQDT